MTRTRGELVEQLRQALPTLLPAHTVLVEEPGEGGGCDLLYVQGRIDRLHAFAVARSVEDLDGGGVAEPLASVAANWRWLAVPAALAARAGKAAAERGFGVIIIGEDEPRVERSASPVPGIFGRQHRDLQKTWRARSSW